MRILSISLKNIKSHRDRELNFVSGINVLSGINGVGKSTIFEAIGYALFGVDARDFVGNIERFITIGEKKGEISVTFETDKGETYRATRTVGPAAKWLLAGEIGDRFELEDHAGILETEARIKKLLGLDSGRSLADQFKLVIGPFQNEFLGPFVLKQPRKRQEAFDETLGIDAWRKTFKSTSTLQAAVKSKIEVLAVEIEGKEELVAVLPERKKELADFVSEAGARQKELTGREKELALLQQQLAVLDKQEKKLAAEKGEIQILVNRITDGKGKITEQKKRVKEAEQALKAVEKSLEGKEAFEAAEKKLKTLREQDKERRTIEKEIIGLDKQCNSLAQTLGHELREVEKTDKELTEEENRIRQDLQDLAADKDLSAQAARLPELKKETEKLRTALGMLDGQRAGLQEGQEKLAEGVCPFFKEHCQNIAGKTPRDVFSDRVGELDRQGLDIGNRLEELKRQVAASEKAKNTIDAIRVRKQELEKQLAGGAGKLEENNRRRKKLDTVRKEQAAAQKKTRARKEELRKYSKLDAEITRIETKRAAHQQARDTYFANQNDAGDLDNRRASLEKMTGLLNELQKSLEQKNKELQQLQKEYEPEHHTDQRKAKEELVAAIASLRQQIESLARDRVRMEKEITKLKGIAADIKTRTAERKTLEAKEQLVKFLRNKIFNNVSTQLSDRFREEISLRADRIYRTIAETDEELFWGDGYRIVLRDMQNGTLRERSDDQLSGGQIMSAVVALRLALLQTIGARVAFFDEPTSNLDAARRENLANAFRAIDVGREEVTEHWYDQLFLISHDVAFTEVTDQIITLE